MSTNLDANKDLVRSFVTAWNERDFGRFDILMAHEATLSVSGMTVPCDPDGTRAIANEWTTAFPDWRFNVRALLADGDLVAAYMPYSGTFAHPISGIAPTNRFAVVDEMVVFRIHDNRVAEAWEVYDEAGMWRQLGIDRPGA